MSDKNDKAFWESSTVKDRKTMAEYVYNKAFGTDHQWPTAVEKNKNATDVASSLIHSLHMHVGEQAIDDSLLNAQPHLFLPWLYLVLERFETKIAITEPTPQKHVSLAYVHRKVADLCYMVNTNMLSKRLHSSLEYAVQTAIRSRSAIKLPKKFKPLPKSEMESIELFIKETTAAIDSKAFKQENTQIQKERGN
ncbi:hypothetical protein DFQ28_004066, partial [Apophysomyces sp. BC1034]